MLNSRTVNIGFFLLLSTVLLLVWRIDLHWLFIAVVITGYIALQVYGATVLGAGFFVTSVARGNPLQGAIALTFDDGPCAGTERILDILRSRKIKAAFFCIGQRVDANPDLARQIIKDGHLIGNHSYYHGTLFDLQSGSAMAADLKKADDVIRKVTGKQPRFFRPPYGVTNPMLATAIQKGNYLTVGWSIRSFDTVIRDSARLVRRVTSRLKAGDIILFHDYSDTTVEALPKILDHAAASGLKIVRLDELINELPYA